MSSKSPLVSIGMPLYNEERYLAQALDSLLAQDFEDFELIISDNASEDATQHICLDYVARDARIRYYRNKVNRGAIENFNHVFRLSSGQYFMWAAGHDLWAPAFLSRCIEVLEQEPSVVLCYPLVRFIDEDGNELEKGNTYYYDTRNSSLQRRLAAAIWPTGCNTFYGVIRSKSLRETRLFRNVWGPDVLPMIELSILGSFANVPEFLVCVRDKWENRKKSYMEWARSCSEALWPGETGWGVWISSHVRSAYEQFLVIRRAPLDYWGKTAVVTCLILRYLIRGLPPILRHPLRDFLLTRLGVVAVPSKTGEVT